VSFFEDFQNSFSQEERQSEIVRILSMAGVNAEKAILEHLNVELRAATELMAFPEQRLRSWLAFFLRPVRNMVSSRGMVLVGIPEADGHFGEAVYLPNGAALLGKNGMLYYQEGQESVSPGNQKWVSVVQGKLVTTTGKYSEFIAIPAVGVDMSDIKVELGGEEVFPVDGESEGVLSGVLSGVCDSLPDEVVKQVLIPGFILSNGVVARVKFSFANFAVDVSLDVSGTGAAQIFYQGELIQPSFLVAGGVYDFTFNSGRWDVSGQSVSPVESVNGSIKPYNGFYAFYYNDTLYIKIFKGPNVIVSSQYRVTYRVSDGVSGNLAVNQFKGYQDSFSYSDGKPVDLRVVNPNPITGGANAPLFYELVAELRRKFFVTTNVASVPEYRAWFLSQPEVFDCLVESDVVRSVASGETGISGVVAVYLMGSSVDPSGVRRFEPFIPSQGSNFMNSLNKVRDIAPITFNSYTPVYNYYLIQYSSSDDNVKFNEDALNLVQRLYSDVGLIRALGLSLFENFDVSILFRGLAGLHNVVGLDVDPFHVREYFAVSSVGGSNGQIFQHETFESVDALFLESYNGEAAGKGRYEVFGSGEEPVLLRTFQESVDIGGKVSIYWDNLVSGDPERVRVGARDANGDVHLKFSYVSEDASFIRCFWPIEDRGVMPVGAGHGARLLWRADVKAYS
jgi:hypothetical protein